MFKNNQPKASKADSSDKRIAIAPYIVDYVERNPNKKIPCAKLGKIAGVNGQYISAVVRELVKFGDLVKVSRYTYAVNPQPLPLLAPAPIPTQKSNIPQEVEALAKDYMWQENGSVTLKGFIDWLKSA